MSIDIKAGYFSDIITEHLHKKLQNRNHGSIRFQPYIGLK